MNGLRSMTLMIASAALVACANEDPTDTDLQPADAVGAAFAREAARGGQRVAGTWTFEETIVVHQPSALNPVIGAPPRDEPVTKVVCRSAGTIDLKQHGLTFEGSATQSVVCRVGDVTFVPPEFAFNPEFTIFAGRIRGRSISFATGHSLNICENEGFTRVRRGRVIHIQAIGRCPVPFEGDHSSFWSIRRAKDAVDERAGN